MTDLKKPAAAKPETAPEDTLKPEAPKAPEAPTAKEYGGREGPEPTRYGDWENKGIISDF
ncbi:MAG: DUF1674 domain-containing protein [Kordiimonadaceae bacterium]|nr:DUF1674 domain-containing protein [Kordiimonadaceae bacterium]